MNDGPFDPSLSTYVHFGQFRSSSFHFGPFDSVWSQSVHLVQFGTLQSILMHLKMEKDVSPKKKKKKFGKRWVWVEIIYSKSEFIKKYKLQNVILLFLIV